MSEVEFRAPRDWSARERWIACLASVLLAAIVLAEPIVRFGTHTLGPWDNIVQQSAQLRGEHYRSTKNPALTDPTRQFVPWALQARTEWEAGRAPLWNSMNCSGVPLLANYQSALLSPFTLPFYVLPLDAASLLSALAKLAAALFFTYGFLRAIQLSRAAAAFGAVAYSWTTGHLMLLLHPHPAVTALLPALLWCTERIFQAAETGQRATAWRWGAMLGLATAITCVAGHPEMLLVDALVCAVYVLMRGLATRSWHVAARASLPLVVGVLLGALLAAPQLLPFAEYMLGSDMYRRPTRFQAVDAPEQLPLLVFPDFIGNPLERGNGVVFTPKPNYQEAEMYYAGALPLWLAVVALALGIWRTRWGLFTGWAVLVVGVVWNIGSLGESIGRFVTAGMIPWGRLYPVLSLGAALSAAWALEHGRREHRPRRWLAIVGVSAIVMFAAAWFGVERFIDAHANEARVDVDTWRTIADAHVGWIALCFGCGVSAVALYGCVRAPKVRMACIAVLLAAHFGSTVFLFGRYVPTVPNENVVAQSESMTELQTLVGDSRTLYVGRDRLPVNTNALYGIEQVVGYDALSVADYETVARTVLHTENYHAEVNYVTRFALKLLGVRYVVSRNEWLPIDTRLGELSKEHPQRSAYYEHVDQREEIPPQLRAEIGPEGLTQTFRATRKDLCGLALQFTCAPAALASPIQVTLRDNATGSTVLDRRVELRQLSWFNHARREFALYFPAISDSAKRDYQLTLRALDPAAPRAEVVLAPRREVDGGPMEASAKRGRRARTAALARSASASLDVGTSGAVEASFTRPSLRFVQDIAYGTDLTPHGWRARARLFEYTESRGEAWVVAGVLPVQDRNAATWQLGRQGFNPYLTVLLEGERAALPPRRELVSSVEALEDGPQRSRWKVRTSLDSFLVLARVHYPGWVVRVDGKPAELLRANLAFCAVELAEGEHEVELSYEPASWRWGLRFAGLGLLGLCGTVVMAGRTGSRKRAWGR
jgi:hypothetical protein